VEVLEQAPKFVLQAGAFQDLGAADRLKRSLMQLTGEPAYVVKVADDALYRVRLGPVEGRPAAQRLQAMIIEARYADPLILEH